LELQSIVRNWTFKVGGYPDFGGRVSSCSLLNVKAEDEIPEKDGKLEVSRY
jgi:hypothetical protein